MANTIPAPSGVKSSDSLPSYRAYMVRCWQERSGAPDGDPIWRFSLDAPWYTERRGFTSLEALMGHLHNELMKQETGPSEQ